MGERISVCIPTCNRPEHFEDALRSVLRQSTSLFEIIVGDDSTDNATARVVNWHVEDGAPIRYRKNNPSLGQAKNVDQLFQEAKGDFIVLLHDDDLLLDGALDALLQCFDEHQDVVAAFGKQRVVDAEENAKPETTRKVNEGYYRTSEYAGRQSSALRSAVVQQFPNDGYMVRADAAKKVGYDQEAVDGCDFAFGVELARAIDGTFYFTNTFTAQYRHSEQSIGRGEGSPESAYRAVKMVLADLPEGVLRDPYVRKWLRSRLPVAIMQAAEHGYADDGLRWYFSPLHRHRILTPGGLWRFARLIHSYLAS